MFKLMDKKIITILHIYFFLTGPMMQPKIRCLKSDPARFVYRMFFYILNEIETCHPFNMYGIVHSASMGYEDFASKFLLLSTTYH